MREVSRAFLTPSVLKNLQTIMDRRPPMVPNRKANVAISRERLPLLRWNLTQTAFRFEHKIARSRMQAPATFCWYNLPCRPPLRRPAALIEILPLPSATQRANNSNKSLLV